MKGLSIQPIEAGIWFDKEEEHKTKSSSRIASLFAILGKNGKKRVAISVDLGETDEDVVILTFDAEDLVEKITNSIKNAYEG